MIRKYDDLKIISMLNGDNEHLVKAAERMVFSKGLKLKPQLAKRMINKENELISILNDAILITLRKIKNNQFRCGGNASINGFIATIANAMIIDYYRKINRKKAPNKEKNEELKALLRTRHGYEDPNGKLWKLEENFLHTMLNEIGKECKKLLTMLMDGYRNAEILPHCPSINSSAAMSNKLGKCKRKLGLAIDLELARLNHRLNSLEH